MTYLSGFPVKELSLKVPFMESSQRDVLEPAIHLSKSPVYEHPPPDSRFPSAGKGPQWREMPVYGAFLNVSYRVPGEEAPPPRPPPRSLLRVESSFPRALFIHLSKSPLDGPPPGSPNGAPMERDARLQSLFYTSFRVSGKGVFPPGSLHRAPTERDAAPPEPLSAISQSPW